THPYSPSVLIAAPKQKGQDKKKKTPPYSPPTSRGGKNVAPHKYGGGIYRRTGTSALPLCTLAL
ncbi:MAG: hypothetical protein P9M15_01175, partial [Candidatus Electryoneaceae bacterium]|nr:hypothetical protein [Candidatus Electryoneaceae bacterium]